MTLNWKTSYIWFYNGKNAQIARHLPITVSSAELKLQGGEGPKVQRSSLQIHPATTLCHIHWNSCQFLRCLKYEKSVQQEKEVTEWDKLRQLPMIYSTFAFTEHLCSLELLSGTSESSGSGKGHNVGSSVSTLLCSKTSSALIDLMRGWHDSSLRFVSTTTCSFMDPWTQTHTCSITFNK